MGFTKVEIELAGKNLSFESGKLAAVSNGAVTVKFGDVVLLVTANMGSKPREGFDFFPLMVDYQEKYYAAGKIKGSRFIKREGRPSDSAILTSRLIDRPLRPLFPKKMRNEVQILATVLSTDQEINPGAMSITAASLAILLAGMPFEAPVSAVRIGLKDGELILEPTYDQVAEGGLDLVVAGTKDSITMVEAGANEVEEEVILKALDLAHVQIKKLCELQEEFLSKVNVEKRPYEEKEMNADTSNKVQSALQGDRLEKLYSLSKDAFYAEKDKIEEEVLAVFESDLASLEEKDQKAMTSDIKECIYGEVKNYMRAKVLTEERRLDGRSLDQVREVNCEVGVLPRTHGSAVFNRGETQVLTVTTLGGPTAAQIIDQMDQDYEKRYMHHYYFPPYAVGEVKPMRGVSRREIGHGDLAERALIPVLPASEKFAYTIQAVSETLGCNGSSSMGSVCGSTLSLMDAGVPIKAPVVGIAMGLISDEEKGIYKVLSDIQAQEDFLGDMDFKVAGTEKGITALQMDIKVKGLDIDLLRGALVQAKKGRDYIWSKMSEAIKDPREKLSSYAPMLTSFKIETDTIRDVIGKGGETIQKITKECGVEIDIKDDGIVTVTAPDQEAGDKAVKWIKQITYVPAAGDVFDGKVTRLMDFGAFVEIIPGKEGLVHISQLAPYRVNKVTDILKEGQPLKVQVLEIDSQGRLNLTHKPYCEKKAPESHAPRPSTGSEGGKKLYHPKKD